MSDAIEFATGLWTRGITPPLRLADYRLAAFDMDSTLISIECVDEIAAAAGKKAEVAAITEAAMRGEIADGALTGRMVDQPWGDICDGTEKRRMLLETCAAIGIDPQRAIAIGDGANDLPMMAAAGLSVAYHAKPRVRAAAADAIDSGGLDRLLDVVRA